MRLPCKQTQGNRKYENGRVRFNPCHLLKKTPGDAGFAGLPTSNAIVADNLFRFVGAAAADLKCARPVCTKTYGACHATASPGNARIAGNKMGSEISNGLKAHQDCS